jgi:hypothetical protein
VIRVDDKTCGFIFQLPFSKINSFTGQLAKKRLSKILFVLQLRLYLNDLIIETKNNCNSEK